MKARNLLSILAFLLLAGCDAYEREEYRVQDDGRHQYLNENVIGNIAFNNPEYLTVGEPSIIEVRLTRNREINIDSDFLGTGDVTVDSLELTRRVRVQLVSIHDDLIIESRGEEEQALDDESFTVWTWAVTAQSAGMKKMEIMIGIANVNDLDPTLPRFMPSRSFEINVKANLRYSVLNFLKSYWQWLLSTILIPLLMWTVNIKLKRDNQEIGARTTAKTPSGETVVIARMWKRVFAFVIDMNFLVVVLVVVFLLYRNLVVGRDVFGLYLLLPIVLSFLYFILLEHFFGTTLGKKVFYMKVVSDNGLKPSFLQIAIRELLRWPSCFTLGFLWHYGNKLNKVAWDRAAKTVVIEEP